MPWERSCVTRVEAFEEAEWYWMTMLQPREARAVQVAAPLSPVPPVMKARWFLKSVIVVGILFADKGSPPGDLPLLHHLKYHRGAMTSHI